MRPQTHLRFSRACAVLVAIGFSATTSLGIPFGALAADGGRAGPAPTPALSALGGVALPPPAPTLIAPGGVATPPLAQPSLPTGIAAAGIAAAAPRARTRAIVSVHRPVLNVLAGHAITFSGVLRPGLEGRLVNLQVLSGRRWRNVAHARTRRHGRYRLRYVPPGIVSERARVRFGGDPADRAAQRVVGRLNVYRLAGASWYGGGGGLACGGSLTSSTLGVANKTLPCGTLVTLRYNGHTVRVPVIDRGPFIAGREFDLTEATKRALGFGDTGQVWSTR